MLRFKGIVFLTITGLAYLAGLVLLVINLDADWRLKVYFRDAVDLHRAVVMFLSAVGGVVLWLLARHVLPAGLRAARTARRQASERQTKQQMEQRIADLESRQEPESPSL